MSIQLLVGIIATCASIITSLGLCFWHISLLTARSEQVIKDIDEIRTRRDACQSKLEEKMEEVSRQVATMATTMARIEERIERFDN